MLFKHNCYGRALLSILNMQMITKDLQFKWTKVTAPIDKQTLKTQSIITTTVSTIAITLTSMLLLCITS